MDEEGRVGILMCAGCAFVCLFLFVSIALTEVALQDRRLVSCADALASSGVGSASSDDFFEAGDPMGVDEASALSRVEEARSALSDSTCRVGEGVVVTEVSARGVQVRSPSSRGRRVRACAMLSRGAKSGVCDGHIVGRNRRSG